MYASPHACRRGAYDSSSAPTGSTLEWDHNYVTRSEEGGGESKYPERVITALEPVA